MNAKNKRRHAKTKSVLLLLCWWALPLAAHADWRKVRQVDLYKITLAGGGPLKQRVPVTVGKIVLSLAKDEAVSIVPAGTKLSGKVMPGRTPTLQ
jgi:hypothetical protein